MQENMERAIDFVLEHEGGFVNHPKDPGGATNYGITKRTLEAYFGRPFTVQDVRNLSVDTAREIYERQYWAHFSGLPAGLDLVAFDFGVNAGPNRAMRHVNMRRRLDGTFPPDMKAVIDNYCRTRLEFYQTLRGYPIFGRGWTRRTEAARRAAHAILDAT